MRRIYIDRLCEKLGYEPGEPQVRILPGAP